MKVGDRSEVSKVFNARDLSDYVSVSGHKVIGDTLPEPLIGALFSYLLGVKLPGMGTMYLKQETSFLNQAFLAEPLTARVEITRLRPDKYLADLVTTCRGADDRIIATGRALVYVGEVGKSLDSDD